MHGHDLDGVTRGQLEQMSSRYRAKRISRLVLGKFFFVLLWPSTVVVLSGVIVSLVNLLGGQCHWFCSSPIAALAIYVSWPLMIISFWSWLFIAINQTEVDYVRRRGWLCGRCGYIKSMPDTKPLERCPECGSTS